MDDLTKKELEKIIEELKIVSLEEEKSKTQTELNKKLHVLLEPFVKNIETILFDCVNRNDPIGLMAIKEILIKYIDGKQGISHSLTEIAYRRSHNKYPPS